MAAPALPLEHTTSRSHIHNGGVRISEMHVYVLTVEINDDAAVADAACRVVEEGHPKRGLLDRGWIPADRVHEVAGVDDGVAEREDALVATSARPCISAEQEDGDGEEDAGCNGTTHLTHLNAAVPTYCVWTVANQWRWHGACR